MGPRRRTWFSKVGVAALAALVAIPWTMFVPDEVLAAPSYKHAIYCGRDFQGRSYPGHGYGLDTFSSGYPDWEATDDQEVMASAAGTVSVEDPGNGHINVLHGGGFETVYAHLDPVEVVHGQQVVAGQLLGRIGMKGDATAPHLHYGQDSSAGPQQVKFNGVTYAYAANWVFGIDINSTHCPTPPATDIWDDNVVSPSRRTSIGWLYMHSPQITSGCGEWFDNPNKRARYCPESIVLRDQMASFLDRYLDLPDTSTDHFTDDEGNIHEQAINNIAEAGITSGCGGTNYCPGGQVTRAQMATFLNRPLIIPNTPNDYFTDDEGFPLHEQAINNLRSTTPVAITTGCGGTNYCPNGLVTRGQMADFLYRGRNYRP